MRVPARRNRRSVAFLAFVAVLGACNDRGATFPVEIEVQLESPDSPPSGALVTTELFYEEIAVKQGRMNAEAAATSVTLSAGFLAALDPAPFARIAHVTDVQIREERAFLVNQQGTAFLEFVSLAHTPAEGAKRQSLQEANSPFVWLATALTLNGIHAQRPIDAVVHTGDGVDVGLRSELAHFLFAARKLDMPFLSVAGNHDILTFGLFGERGPALGFNLDPGIKRRTAVEVTFTANQERLLVERPIFAQAFRDISTSLGAHPPTLARFGSQHYGTDLGPQPDDLFYAVTVRPPAAGLPGLVLIVLETSRDDGAGLPELDDRQFAFLNDTLDLPATRQSLVVVAGHHPLYEISRDNAGLGQRTDVRVSGPLARVHQALGHYPNVVAYLCGHTHLPDIVEDRDPTTNALRWVQIDSGAILIFPQEGSLVDLRLQTGAPPTELNIRGVRFGQLVDPATTLGLRMAEAHNAAFADDRSRPRYQTWTSYDGTRALPALPVTVPKLQ